MYGKLLLSFFIFHASLTLSAQEDDWRLYKPTDLSKDSSAVSRSAEGTSPAYYAESDTPQAPGKVGIKADRKILLLDSLKREKPSALSGFRLQLFFGGRAEAQKIRGEFLKIHPEMGAYISYLAPNFRLRVGDFRTKAECEALKKKVEPDFPGCYIVKDEINLPPLRPKEEKED